MRHAPRSGVLGRADMPAYLRVLRPWLAAHAACHPRWPLSGQAPRSHSRQSRRAEKNDAQTLDADHLLRRRWCSPRRLDGDGSFDDAVGLTPSASFPKAGTYVVALRATREGHDAVSYAVVRVADANRAPVLSARHLRSARQPWSSGTRGRSRSPRPTRKAVRFRTPGSSTEPPPARPRRRSRSRRPPRRSERTSSRSSPPTERPGGAT